MNDSWTESSWPVHFSAAAAAVADGLASALAAALAGALAGALAAALAGGLAALLCAGETDAPLGPHAAATSRMAGTIAANLRFIAVSSCCPARRRAWCPVVPAEPPMSRFGPA